MTARRWSQYPDIYLEIVTTYQDYPDGRTLGPMLQKEAITIRTNFYRFRNAVQRELHEAPSDLGDILSAFELLSITMDKTDNGEVNLRFQIEPLTRAARKAAQ